MKKIITGIIAVLYMLATCGIAMEIHYCMGKKAGINFYFAKDDACGKCGMKEKKKGCCHNEHKFAKLSGIHKNVYNNIAFTTPEILIAAIQYHLYSWQLPNAISLSSISNHSPPNYAMRPACILNCVFRI